MLSDYLELFGRTCYAPKAAREYRGAARFSLFMCLYRRSCRIMTTYRNLVLSGILWLLCPSAWAGDIHRCTHTAPLGAESLNLTPVCWEEAHPFATAFGDPIDYCRGHLRFTPGAADCFMVTDLVCITHSFDHKQRVQSQQTRQEYYSQPFVCPDGPKPPQCPGSYPTFRR